ncbi:helix-turn-helix domain-containing protein [uncultured Lutibacter sp.]|uniref:helix-turn-helix domain-containing protein n=1 Tax=uncultured Lutibacter sp. TaxID=437739 RepID=UPI0026387B66|nr:helix-turn-helix domain-containing protein [uncultured Lutibacter sp.]
MEVIILSVEQFTKIENSIEELKKKIEGSQKSPKITFLDNQEFIQLMNISKRTAQTWRDNSVIPFSQIGNKIYYKISNVEMLLEKNSHNAFRNERKQS